MQFGFVSRESAATRRSQTQPDKSQCYTRENAQKLARGLIYFGRASDRRTISLLVQNRYFKYYNLVVIST